MKRVEVVRQGHVPRCWKCGAKLGAHHGDALPEPGDVSICAHCGAAAIYDHTQRGELTLRAPLNAEEAEDCAAAIREVLGL